MNSASDHGIEGHMHQNHREPIKGFLSVKKEKRDAIRNYFAHDTLKMRLIYEE